MHVLLRLVKSFLKKQAPLLSKLFGLTLLTKPQTNARLALQATQVAQDPGELVTLPRVTACSAILDKQLFGEETLRTAPAYVWRLANTDGQLTQLPSGNLVLHKQVLDLDFGNGAVLQDLVKRAPRQQRATTLLIAPWTHYWTGYFDYVFFIALKLCRIKQQLSAQEFAEALICYPLFNTRFEQEILTLLGVTPANVVDSRHTEVVFDTCLIGNNDSWFYPNKQDVLVFSNLVQRPLKPTKAANTRLYIQRTGRRRIRNEGELLRLLEKLDFIIVADVPRAYAEQLALYHDASFIMGPHGASFANIVGCRAGTQLLELFADAYVPGYFRYLAQVLGLPYAAYCAGQPNGSDHRHVADDMVVDVADLEQQLNRLLALPLDGAAS
jgi:capsular polysaccharide biosynthesis protein